MGHIWSHEPQLYNDPADNLVKWIPWDNNEALQAGKMEGALDIELTDVTDDWPLISFIIEQEEYRNTYKEYIRSFISTVFYPSRMQNIYDEQAALIQSYVTGENGENEGYSFLKTDNDFSIAVNELKSHVSERKTVAENYIN